MTSDDAAAPVAPRPAPQRQAPLLLNNPGAESSAFRAQPSVFGDASPAAARAPQGPGAPQPPRVGGDDAEMKTVHREGPKVGRNDPCPCGSGKKYKKCHGAAA